MKTVAIIQARTSSTRLPGKVLLPIYGKPAIEWTIDRISACKEIDHFVVSTTSHPNDNALANLCDQLGVSCFRGDENDVLDRYYQTACFMSVQSGDKIVRITGDCPFIDPDVCDAVVRLQRETGADYASNVLSLSYPDGLDCEVFRFEALEKAWREAKMVYEREHVTQYMIRNPDMFTQKNLSAVENRSNMRWTLDQPEDYRFLSAIAEHFGRCDFTTQEIIVLLQQKPSLLKINSAIERNESLKADLFNESCSEVETTGVGPGYSSVEKIGGSA